LVLVCGSNGDKISPKVNRYDKFNLKIKIASFYSSWSFLNIEKQPCLSSIFAV